MRLLLVEDDVMVASGIKLGLTDAGYAVEVTSKSGNKFKITKSDVAGGSGVARTCTAQGKFGCPQSLKW